MNSRFIYNNLMRKALLRGLDEYKRGRKRPEKWRYVHHHVIARMDGGTDEPENMRWLTEREHFLAHWLLYRIDGDPFSMAGMTFFRMRDFEIIYSREYASRREHGYAVMKEKAMARASN
ncbi:TPA: HNH endonuclease signature motif containing protein [Escherichia coli]